jgi:PAS domain S-box-containing protein
MGDKESLAREAPAQATGLSWALAHAAEGLLVLDEHCAVVHANPAACETLRQSALAMAGAEFWELLPGEAAGRHEGPAARMLESARPYIFSLHRKFEGQWLEFHMAPAPEGVVVSVRDTTAARESQAARRKADYQRKALFDANPNAMWVFDANNLRLLAVNEAALLFYGYTQDDFLAMPLARLYPEEDAESLRELLPGLNPGHTFGEGSQLGRQRKNNGDVILAELSGNVIDWEGTRAVLVTVTDVTRQYVAESTLRQLNEELEERVAERTKALQQSTRELEIFSYSVSHDLLAPLHAVDGFTRTLLDRYTGKLDDKGIHYLSRIQASARQMAKLVEDLSKLARISRMALTPRAFDIAPVCKWAVDTLRRDEPGREVTLEVDPSLQVVGDQALLAKALVCLLENAWKFTGRKPHAWIRVGSVPSEDPGTTTLFVSDNGDGFDPAYGHKLFRAFQRLHSAADYPGSGLGLAIVRRIAARHDGKVWAESVPGSGATFYMMLPHSVAPQPEPPALPETMSGLL